MNYISSLNHSLINKYGPRESIEYDIIIVGGGPSGLSAAIRLKQLAIKKNKEIKICVLEKGSELGAHILSGAIIDPRSIFELFPKEKLKKLFNTPVIEDRFLFLSSKKSYKIPFWVLPICFKNHGNYIISLSHLVRWMGKKAENMGIDIFSGFSASEILYDNKNNVCGIATNNFGINKKGIIKKNFQLGMELYAKYTLFAEGSRGHLSKQLIKKFNLDNKKDPQTYSIGIKELWRINPKLHKKGLAIHTIGWPLDSKTYGGGFLYHMENNQISIGYIISLDYKNPYLSPFEEFQRYKTHPEICKILKDGQRISYGARTITTGGLQSLPEFIFNGGAFIGCNAGFMNVSRIKGIHTSIKSGILAADSIFNEIYSNKKFNKLITYKTNFQTSWLYKELYKARNFKPAMKKGLYIGMLIIGIDQILFSGKFPFTLHNINADYTYLEPASKHIPIKYPNPDNKLTFDKLTSIYISNINHDEDQPIHLILKNKKIPININFSIYAGPEARYCPAGVYEFILVKNKIQRLQINAQNCIHCKTCDIKDPTQNIEWITPEGGSGTNYPNM
ncbi:electron transfer flavoprotein-ubiquinone oxidoreductase [Candidatus Profftella armatura (Diaphorina cf. continua)]|uniref:Electron transfer flavoprotein-ubiquinone oxidoreductase n=1 Tax=Candidatus Profftella armatura (Diaphorina cf. continua) TaxID=2661583 RepID=A0A7R6VYY8_9PROT|nr:electron transfer flavoprotein-ubiquinone oxidoreductase [Candidatus Profftella armatura (Diaphorina cf. continua)]BCG49679.1 electron transfer flavoprotein-ubiquinone oxidoreductase [Candidatus Profftella armatura (Diaphorina cf. continua)]